MTGPDRGPVRRAARHCGVGRERIVYASAAGPLATSRVIGEPVARGDPLGRIGEWTFFAPNAGTVRGLVRAGVVIGIGDKLAEVDPRPPASAIWTGIGERPRRVASGVLKALSMGPSD